MYVFAAITLAIVLVLAVLARSPKFLGSAGEMFVRYRLSDLPLTDYRVLNDLLIPRSDGTTTQIDHVVISRFGIFVVETKNYKGLIIGRDRDKEWMQILNRRRKHRFLSPVVQNRIHIRALQEILPEVEHSAFHSIVVFSNEAKLRTEVTEAEVVNVRNLVKTIRSFTTPALTEEQVRDMCERIAAANKRDSASRREHVVRVRGVKQAVSEGICPRCGGRLTLRKSKHGEFFGCSNFPRCRFVKRV